MRQTRRKRLHKHHQRLVRYRRQTYFKQLHYMLPAEGKEAEPVSSVQPASKP